MGTKASNRTARSTSEDKGGGRRRWRTKLDSLGPGDARWRQRREGTRAHVAA